jgi:ATP-dependent Clp protease ATP-binding subunit ClpA
MSLETASKKLDELLEQVQKINNEIKNLKGQVMDEKVYKLNEKQMKEFVSGLYYSFSEWNQNEISSVEFSESVVTLDVDGYTIIPTIDSDMISDEIQQYTEVPTEIQMMNMATEVMQDLSIELVDGNCE